MNTIQLTIEDEDGVEQEHQLPAKWEICGNCHGEGKHSHAVDGNGITSSEWAEWDDEERETYMSGGYDKTCEECSGSGKVRVLDEGACTPEQLELYEKDARAKWEADAADRSEARYFSQWER